MTYRITWVEKDTNTAACLGLDETIESGASPDQIRESARYGATLAGVDLERYEPLAEPIDNAPDPSEPCGRCGEPSAAHVMTRFGEEAVCQPCVEALLANGLILPHDVSADSTGLNLGRGS
jgi:hypothetical protein